MYAGAAVMMITVAPDCFCIILEGPCEIFEVNRAD